MTCITNSEIYIPNYSIVRCDRNRHGGGVIIYCLSSYPLNIIYKGSDELELLIVSINTYNLIVVATMYRPPNLFDSVLDDLFFVLCNHVDVSIFGNFVLIGDFNVNFFVSNNSLFQKLLSVTSSFN